MNDCIRCSKGPNGARILHSLSTKVRGEKKWMCNVCIAELYNYLDKDALVIALFERKSR